MKSAMLQDKRRTTKMKSHFDKPIALGMFIVAVTLLMQRFFNIPDFVAGLLFGLSLTISLVGFFSCKKNNEEKLLGTGTPTE